MPGMLDRHPWAGSQQIEKQTTLVLLTRVRVCVCVSFQTGTNGMCLERDRDRGNRQRPTSYVDKTKLIETLHMCAHAQDREPLGQPEIANLNRMRESCKTILSRSN
eukprot:6490778-Amphidinium_carterae.2